MNASLHLTKLATILPDIYIERFEISVCFANCLRFFFDKEKTSKIMKKVILFEHY